MALYDAFGGGGAYSTKNKKNAFFTVNYSLYQTSILQKNTADYKSFQAQFRFIIRNHTMR